MAVGDTLDRINQLLWRLIFHRSQQVNLKIEERVYKQRNSPKAKGNQYETAIIGILLSHSSLLYQNFSITNNFIAKNLTLLCLHRLFPDNFPNFQEIHRPIYSGTTGKFKNRYLNHLDIDTKQIPILAKIYTKIDTQNHAIVTKQILNLAPARNFLDFLDIQCGQSALSLKTTQRSTPEN